MRQPKSTQSIFAFVGIVAVFEVDSIPIRRDTGLDSSLTILCILHKMHIAARPSVTPPAKPPNRCCFTGNGGHHMNEPSRRKLMGSIAAVAAGATVAGDRPLDAQTPRAAAPAAGRPADEPFGYCLNTSTL